MVDIAILEEFVTQSNLIEEIYEGPGYPLYDDYLRACDLVSRASLMEISPPASLHKTIMRSQPEHNPGRYRVTRVEVGGHEAPDPGRVPSLMMIMLAKLTWMEDLSIAGQRPSEEAIWDLHNEFEYIHPFSDGNGRTGRLWLNAIRLYFGFPWLTVFDSEKEAYYQRIREWTARRN